MCVNSCARNIGVLNKLKHFVPEQALYRLYCSLVLPYFNYGLLLWGNANKTSLGKVYKLQKRALRIISNSHYLSSSKPLFEKYNVLNIFDMYKRETGIFMYKYRNNMYLNHLMVFLQIINQIIIMILETREITN